VFLEALRGVSGGLLRSRRHPEPRDDPRPMHCPRVSVARCVLRSPVLSAALLLECKTLGVHSEGPLRGFTTWVHSEGSL